MRTLRGEVHREFTQYDGWYPCKCMGKINSPYWWLSIHYQKYPPFLRVFMDSNLKYKQGDILSILGKRSLIHGKYVLNIGM